MGDVRMYYSKRTNSDDTAAEAREYPFIVLLDVTLSRLFCITLIVTKTGGATERKDIVVKIIRPKLSWDQ